MQAVVEGMPPVRHQLHGPSDQVQTGSDQIISLPRKPLSQAQVADMLSNLLTGVVLLRSCPRNISQKKKHMGNAFLYDMDKLTIKDGKLRNRSSSSYTVFFPMPNLRNSSRKITVFPEKNLPTFLTQLCYENPRKC